MIVKRVVLFLMIAVLAISALVSCAPKEAEAFKVGLITDGSTIDDKSFNQSAWEGIVRATEEFEIDYTYLKPTGSTEAEFLLEVGNLYDGGHKFIVTPGFFFETTVFAAQSAYPDAKFVLIGGTPHAGDGNTVVGPNTVAIFFAEQESGFFAGLAAAIELNEGEFGFIGGMALPPVQKFNWGFQQGLAYANENLGTNVSINAENVIYQGSFDDVAAGQQIAAQMFEKGVDAIFCAAGGVGVGVINEGKSRARSGEKVWVIGVDLDQYDDGIYEGNKSVILTSAVKRVDNATYSMIKAEFEGSFPGGQTITLDAAKQGVGIPAQNPNLSATTEEQVKNVLDLVVSGDVQVSGEQGNLIP